MKMTDEQMIDYVACKLQIGERLAQLAEEAAELTPVKIALDGIAVIVNPENALDDLSTEQVCSIFTGEITDWSELG